MGEGFIDFGVGDGVIDVGEEWGVMEIWKEEGGQLTLSRGGVRAWWKSSRLRAHALCQDLEPCGVLASCRVLWGLNEKSLGMRTLKTKIQ